MTNFEITITVFLILLMILLSALLLATAFIAKAIHDKTPSQLEPNLTQQEGYDFYRTYHAMMQQRQRVKESLSVSNTQQPTATKSKEGGQ